MKEKLLVQLQRAAWSKSLMVVGGTALMMGTASAADEIATVMVTSQSRRQAVQDVPITMQVLGSKEIETLGARDLAGLDGYLPGVEIDGSQSTQPVFGIRGVRAMDFGIGTDAPVGIYVDGVYTGKSSGALMNFVDVQRIEVLKGPQGTLFGRNSAAGAIAVVSNQPDAEFDSLAHLRLGQNQRLGMDAMLNVPLTDSSAMRMVLVRDSEDGWARNLASGHPVAGHNSWGGRVSVQQRVGASTFNLAWEHEQLRQHSLPAFGVVQDSAQPLASFRGAYDSAYLAHLVDPRKAPLRNENDGAEGRLFDGLTLHAQVPLGNVQLSSITSYRRYRSHNLLDTDGVARPDFSIATENQQRAWNWQQEFKLSGKSDQWDWIGGLSFYDNREQQNSTVLGNTATLDTLSLLQGGSASFADMFAGLGAAGLPGVSASSNFPWQEVVRNQLKTRAVSLYADVIWHASAATNVTAGLRWSVDRKQMRWHIPSRTTPALDSVLNDSAALTGMDASALPSNVILAGAPLAAQPVSESKRWHNWSPRVVLDQKLNRDTLLFASFSQGYQAGGYNIFTPPNPQASSAQQRDPSFAPEKMSNLELGMKAAFPALRASLNGALFAYQFKNLQDLRLSTGGAIPIYNTINSDQKAHGLDLDGRIKLTTSTSLFANAEWINQSYQRFITADEQGKVVLNLSGQPVGTPFWSAAAGVTQNWPLAAGRLSATLQGSYRGRQRCNDDTQALQCLQAPSFSTGGSMKRADLHLAWEAPSHQFGIALTVNNLFDQRYVLNLDGVTKTAGMPYANVTAPRAVVLELKGSL